MLNQYVTRMLSLLPFTLSEEQAFTVGTTKLSRKQWHQMAPSRKAIFRDCVRRSEMDRNHDLVMTAG